MSVLPSIPCFPEERGLPLFFTYMCLNHCRLLAVLATKLSSNVLHAWTDNLLPAAPIHAMPISADL